MVVCLQLVVVEINHAHEGCAMASVQGESQNEVVVQRFAFSALYTNSKVLRGLSQYAAQGSVLGRFQASSQQIPTKVVGGGVFFFEGRFQEGFRVGSGEVWAEEGSK